MITFSNLSKDSDLVTLLLSQKKHRLPKKHPINIDSQSMILCYIHKGYLKRYMITNEGNESIHTIYGPEETFPLNRVFREFLGQTIYMGEVYYYATLTDTVFYSIDKETLSKNLEQNPLLYKDLLQVAGYRLESNFSLLENATLRSARSRIAHLLLYFADKFGKKTENGVLIEIKLTHNIIASHLNLARETVSQYMSVFSDKNFITLGLKDSFYTITDYDALRRVVR